MSLALLGGWVRARRHHLGLSQKELAARSVLGERTLRAIEGGTGEHAVLPRSLRALERGLSWPPGSLDAALAAGQPPQDTAADAADGRFNVVYPALYPPAESATMISLPTSDLPTAAVAGPSGPAATPTPVTTAVLARWIRERRTQLGLTRADAAAGGPLTQVTWRSLESGGRPNIRPSTRRALERALSWPPGSLDAALASGQPPVPTPTPAGGENVPALAELGRWIHQRRKQLGLTQLEVAAAGPIASKTFINIERGRRAALRAPTRRALERALSWEPGSLDAALATATPPPPLPGTEPPVPVADSDTTASDGDAAGTAAPATAEGADPFAHARSVLTTLDAYRTLRAALGDDSPLEEALAELLRNRRDAEVAVGRQMQWVAEDDAKRREAAQLIVALQQPL